MNVGIHPAAEADILALAPVMRASDRLELERASGLGPEEALRDSVAASGERAAALYYDGQVAALFGIATGAACPTVAPGVAIPWFLASDLVERHPATTLRLALRFVSGWAREFPVLFQMVDAGHPTAPRFLRALGFELGDAVPHGPQGLPFHPAVRSTRHV